MTEVAAIEARYDGNVVHKEITEARGNKLFSLAEFFLLFSFSFLLSFLFFLRLMRRILS